MIKLKSPFWKNVNYTQQFIKSKTRVKKYCLNWYLSSVYLAKKCNKV